MTMRVNVRRRSNSRRRAPTGRDRKSAISVDNSDLDDDVAAVDLKRKAKAKAKVKAEPSSSKKRKRSAFREPVVEIEDDTDAGEPAVFCPICMEPELLSKSLCITGCFHWFCLDCVRQYVFVRVQESATSIGCPSPGCKNGIIEPTRCGDFLPPEVFERWCTALCESLACFYCPFKDCSVPLMDETLGGSTGEVLKECECPHCWRLFCAQCKVPWHAELSCEEFQKLASDERDSDDLKLMRMAKKCNWRRCSNCKVFVERISGCRFITCRCGHIFCYTCGSRMSTDHYCATCMC